MVMLYTSQTMSYYIPQGPFIKTADEATMNNTELQDIAGLTFVVNVGTYLLRANIYGQSSGFFKSKVALALSSSGDDESSLFVTAQNWDNATDQENIEAWDTQTTNQGLISGQDSNLILEGILVIGTPGDLTIQLFTDENDCAIYPSSNMILQRI